MEYTWSQIFKAHQLFKNAKISYDHICDTAFDIALKHAGIVSTNCIDVANKIFDKPIEKTANVDINEIVDLKFLFLEELDLDNIFQIVPLKKLEIINCRKNEIDSLVPLKNMYNLKKLYMPRNRISNLKPINELRQLEVLDLSENNITYTLDLFQLENIIDIDLSQNCISEFYFSSKFKLLKSLGLNDNNLEYINGLEECKNLETLTLYGNRFLKLENVVEQKKKKPDCRIYVNYIPDGSETELFGYLQLYNDHVFFICMNEIIEKQSYHVIVSIYKAENNYSIKDFRDDMKIIAWNHVVEILYSKGSIRKKEREICLNENKNVISVQYELE